LLKLALPTPRERGRFELAGLNGTAVDHVAGAHEQTNTDFVVLGDAVHRNWRSPSRQRQISGSVTGLSAHMMIGVHPFRVLIFLQGLMARSPDQVSALSTATGHSKILIGPKKHGADRAISPGA
jgi:hypothetical protein